MDSTVRALLKFVVRGFYSQLHVLVIDAVLMHSVLAEDDLSHLLGIQRKELRSICSKLVDDRLLTVHVQKEEGPQQRPISRTYYYIHFTEAIDAIKWKLHSVVSSVKNELHADSNPQGYMCPVCKTKYSQLDAVSLLNYEKNQFLCSLCDVKLVEDDSGKTAKENQAKYSSLMKQLEPIVEYLKQIDEQSIAENSFESSLEKIIPAQANTLASYSVSSKNSRMFDRNSYLTNKSSISAGSRSQATLHVNITTANDDLLQSEQKAHELEEKRKQNALPAWHEQSTVGGASQLGKLDPADDSALKHDDDLVSINTGLESSSGKSDITMTTASSADHAQQHAQHAAAAPQEQDKESEDALAAYYEQLAKQQQEEDDEEEEEEDDEFEDIEPSQTPAPAATASPKDDNILEELEFSDEE